MRSNRANQGKAWEQQLETLHQRYLSNGRACIFPTPPRVKVLKMGSRGRFTGCFESDGPPDYCGSAGGRAVVFDAKSTASERWSLGAVSKGQVKHLTGIIEQLAALQGKEIVDFKPTTSKYGQILVDTEKESES